MPHCPLAKPSQQYLDGSCRRLRPSHVTHELCKQKGFPPMQCSPAPHAAGAQLLEALQRAGEWRGQRAHPYSALCTVASCVKGSVEWCTHARASGSASRTHRAGTQAPHRHDGQHRPRQDVQRLVAPAHAALGVGAGVAVHAVRVCVLVPVGREGSSEGQESRRDGSS